MSAVSLLKFVLGHPINSRQPARALFRLLAWQLRARTRRGPFVHEWVNGSKLYARRGETGVTGNVYCGLHEFADMAFLLHLLRPGDQFVDVGANSGSYTVLASAAVGARSTAFEPVPAAFQRLEANVRLNNVAGRVSCHNLGLAGSPGMLRFTSGSDTTNHAIAEGERDLTSIEVRVTTLDEALVHAPLLMKIDVEGYETPVIDGATNTLRNSSVKALIVELNGASNHYGLDEGVLLQRLLDFGFSTYSYDPLARELLSLHGKNLTEGNTLFVRDESFVRARLATAPRFSVAGRVL